jgi:hypothetical protein
MNEHKQSEGASDPGNQSVLSQWLQQVLAATSASDAASSLAENEQNEYHPHFYQQLPDFVLALLNKQPQATLHYAPLLYHLVGCPTCHAAYLDLYAAMRAAIQPDQSPGQPQGPTPHRPTALAPTILRLRCPRIVLCADHFELRYVVEPHFTGCGSFFETSCASGH